MPPGQIGGHGALVDAVRDAYASVCAAGEEQAGMPGQRGINRGQAVTVTDDILRVRLAPPVHPGQDRLSRDPHDRPEFVTDHFHDRIVLLGHRRLGPGASHKTPEQGTARRRAVGKLG